MKVTSIRIFPIQNRKGVLAAADIVLDQSFVVTDLRITEHNGRLSVQYPVSQFASSNTNRYVCNPINRETQEMIERKVLEAYRKEGGAE